MKKFLLILTAVILCFFSLSHPISANAEGDELSYNYARVFAAAHPARDPKSGKELAAASYLASALGAMGYEVSTPSFKYFDAEEGAGGQTYAYEHVVGFKDLGKEKTVVIGGYYGGFAPSDAFGTGEGGEIALSVGVLLSVAKKLANASADHNIAIAFWGGAAFSDFKAAECGVPLDKIALYIGLDAVAAGERDYLYCDDTPRSHEKYFRSAASSVGAEISSPPAFKRSLSLYEEEGAYAYVHLGLLGVNRCFMAQNVPCAAFVGGAWEKDCGLYRYNGKTEISGTSLDTIDEIDRRNGGKENTARRAEGVANTVVCTVTGAGLKPALEAAAKDVSGADLENELAYALINFIGGAAAIAFLLIFFLKQGKDRKDEVWQEAFEKKEPSPFSEFGGDASEPPRSADDPDDDVFRF